MRLQIMTSQEARERWRQVTLGAVAGKTTIITLYGDEVGAFVPIEDYKRMMAALEAQGAQPTQETQS